MRSIFTHYDDDDDDMNDEVRLIKAARSGRGGFRFSEKKSAFCRDKDIDADTCAVIICLLIYFYRARRHFTPARCCHVRRRLIYRRQYRKEMMMYAFCFD